MSNPTKPAPTRRTEELSKAQYFKLELVKLKAEQEVSRAATTCANNDTGFSTQVSCVTSLLLRAAHAHLVAEACSEAQFNVLDQVVTSPIEDIKRNLRWLIGDLAKLEASLEKRSAEINLDLQAALDGAAR